MSLIIHTDSDGNTYEIKDGIDLKSYDTDGKERNISENDIIREVLNASQGK